MKLTLVPSMYFRKYNGTFEPVFTASLHPGVDGCVGLRHDGGSATQCLLREAWLSSAAARCPVSQPPHQASASSGGGGRKALAARSSIKFSVRSTGVVLPGPLRSSIKCCMGIQILPRLRLNYGCTTVHVYMAEYTGAAQSSRTVGPPPTDARRAAPSSFVDMD